MKIGQLFEEILKEGKKNLADIDSMDLESRVIHFLKWLDENSEFFEEDGEIWTKRFSRKKIEDYLRKNNIYRYELCSGLWHFTDNNWESPKDTRTQEDELRNFEIAKDSFEYYYGKYYKYYRNYTFTYT